MSYLLDTNVISELRRPAAMVDPHVRAWADAHYLEEQYLSAVTLYELELGVRSKERVDEIQGRALRRWLEGKVKPMFEGRILAFDGEVAVTAASKNVPDRRPLADSFIAATAHVHQLTVVTRNVGDFSDLGVPVVNPWEPPTQSSY